MTAGLHVDHSDTALVVCPAVDLDVRKHGKRLNGRDSLCRPGINIQLRRGFRYGQAKQYPFCRSEMYFSAPRRIYLRPPPVQVEAYC
jgi:hypothetical protein